MGAGERMTRAVAARRVRPHLVTLGVAAMLVVWAVYAWSGAGLIEPLPLLWPVLVAITAIYLLRAATLPVLLRTMCDRSRRFLFVSSAIVLGVGVIHCIGLATAWRDS